MSKLRERFEAWMKDQWANPNLGRWAPNERYYADPETQCDWEAYQAALEPVRELIGRWNLSGNPQDWERADELAKLLEE
jgi:hypothetical protein